LILEPIFQDHPSIEELLPAVREDVRLARELVVSADLATIPPGDNCRIEQSPPALRGLSSASMNSPGPFDQTMNEGIYYITLVEPAWSSDEKEEWLRKLNRSKLQNITLHEVYPGHYLQRLHSRAAGGTLTRKVFFSNAFCEGWAHYAEQLSIEAMGGGASPASEIVQLLDAVLRDVRLIVSVRMHTQHMSLDEASALFEREAHLGTMLAKREAIRGTWNPGYFSYTLGKLAILEARQTYLESVFGGSLRRFHDRLLSFGQPPIGLLGALIANPH